MGKYNANSLFRTLPGGALCALLIAGCAQQPQQAESYPVDMPATTTAPAPMAAPADAAPEPLAAPVTVTAGPALRDNVPLHYVVKKGDTLWDISNHFLLSPWQWPEIWYGNGQVKNPHKIYPGDVLSLITVNGKPQLVSGDGGSVTQTLDSSHVSPRVRTAGLDEAIPAIPLDVIRDFLSDTRVVTPEELDAAPYVVAFMEPQVAAGAGSRAYIKGIKTGAPAKYNVVRLGQTYHDPENGDLLGYEAIPLGTAEVVDASDKLVVVNLTTTEREVLPGDRLLPLETETFDPYFYPKAPDVKVKARIIGALGGVSQITQYMIVALNRGTSQGLQRGDVLQIRQTGRVARDPHSGSSEPSIKLPDLDAGLLMVFKTAPRLSYGLVMSADRSIHKLDRAENPKSLH